nr:hypothetical protein CFP56_12127 [Quercus suber]
MAAECAGHHAASTSMSATPELRSRQSACSPVPFASIFHAALRDKHEINPAGFRRLLSQSKYNTQTNLDSHWMAVSW